MNKTILMGFILGTIALMMTSLGTANFAFAGNPNTDEPNRWGEVTSGAATEDGQQNIGEHADADDNIQPREGLGNAGEKFFNLDSKHPSELAEALCGTGPSVPGCN